jgi:hypothetical protein
MTKKLDPNRIVTTEFGKKVKRKECRAIKGSFYKMNEECFKIDGRWYRINSGFLVKDVDSDKWILKEGSNIICGLFYSSKEGAVKAGFFTKDVFKNVPIYREAIPSHILSELNLEGGTAYAISMEVIEKLGLKEDIPSGIYNLPEKASSKIAIGGNYNFKIDYSFENSGNSIKIGFQEYLSRITTNVANTGFIGDKTFGWEFETTDGFIHPRYLLKTGLIPLRDGSISGYEFVTCPMKGKKGIQTTLEAADILKKYTTNNISCALHLHIGNVPVTEEYLTLLYKTTYAIQNDVFKMFPKALSKTSSYKDRDYCNKLPKLQPINAEQIINWTVGSSSYYSNNFRGLGKRNHPNDESNTRKWSISQRYLWVNFIPYIFSKRGTIEFRIHTPTTNKAKLINWLYICSGILTFVEKYAKNYTNETLSRLTLTNLLKAVYGNSPDVLEYLLRYIKWRTDYMVLCSNQGDDVGTTEIMGDDDFTFKYKGKDTLVSGYE